MLRMHQSKRLPLPWLIYAVNMINYTGVCTRGGKQMADGKSIVISIHFENVRKSFIIIV